MATRLPATRPRHEGLFEGAATYAGADAQPRVGETACREGVPRGLLLLSWRRHTAQSSAPSAVGRRADLAARSRAAQRRWYSYYYYY